MEELPVIDVRGPRRPDGATHGAVAAAIDAAARAHGFFYVTGHGVPELVQDRLEGGRWTFSPSRRRRRASAMD